MIVALSTAEMREVDAQAIDELGIPGVVLMENAGRSVVRVVENLLGNNRDTSTICVLCGGGNNGGDGFVVARVLQGNGRHVELFLCVERSALRGDAAVHAAAYEKCGGTTQAACSEEELATANGAISEANLVVDALFGIGLDRPLVGCWLSIVNAINSSPAQVVAVDIASGLHADDGRTMGAAVRATETVAIASAKIAHVTAPGFEATGVLHIAEIGIPKKECEARGSVFVLEADDLLWPQTLGTANSHKGMRGHVLAIAGSEGMRGAGRLAGLAAMRAGAGLVTLAGTTRDAFSPDVLMTAALKTSAELAALAQGKSAILVGPGLSLNSGSEAVLRESLKSVSLPLVLDAGALALLQQDLSPVRERAATECVMTPHPGEAGRLLGITTSEVQSDRVAAVRQLAQASACVVILKGARSCICDGASTTGQGRERSVVINPTGGPELSTAGTGDVLAGMVVALLAQGLSAWQASILASYWHGEAGRIAAQTLGGPGLVASDLLAAIPKAATLHAN